MQATVKTDATGGQSQNYIATLQYQYIVGTKVFDGYVLRRCLRKSSAEEVIAPYPPGSVISIRYNPHKPERSYAPLPLGWGGFLIAGPLVFFSLAIFAFAIFAAFQNRYIETHYAIPDSEWHAVEVGNRFKFMMPDTPTVSRGYHENWQVDGMKPQTVQWTVVRPETYFYLEVLSFPPGTSLAHDCLDQVLANLKAEKHYVYKDTSMSLERRPGREFQYTRPYNTIRTYIDASDLYNDLYILGTDGYVDTDMQKFFDSFHFVRDAR